MQVFLYEFVTGGGWYAADNDVPPSSLAAEGRRMRDALLADLMAIDDVEVVILEDSRTAESIGGNCTLWSVTSARQEQDAFRKAAAQADWTIVIAPEFRGFLAERHRWVSDAKGHLLGQPPRVVELAADKQHTASFLSQIGIATPVGCRIEANAVLPTDFSYPAVIKPIDGAGSQDVQLVHNPHDDVPESTTARRLERYCPGLPASIAFLSGPAQKISLPPSEQVLSHDGRFSYLGGRWPLAAELDRRARLLGERVMAGLPDAFGFLGIDLVLGEDPNGRDDFVIEINPRITTSYVGLRELIHTNLAEAMLALAKGSRVELSFDDQPLRFEVDGRIHRQAVRGSL